MVSKSIESGNYEDGSPLVRILNWDEWDGADPYFELRIEFTRNPINLFGGYLNMVFFAYNWNDLADLP